MKKTMVGFLLLATALLTGGCASLIQAPGSVQAAVESVASSAPPGGELRARVRVNPSNFTGNVLLSLDGPPGFSLVEPTASVRVEGPTAVNVRVRVGEGVQPGDYTLRLTLRPQGLEAIPLAWQVSVTRSGGLQAVRATAPRNLQIWQDRTANLEVALENPNPSPVRATVGVVEVNPGDLAASLTPPRTVDLPAGGVATVALTLRGTGTGRGQATLQVTTTAVEGGREYVVGRETLTTEIQVSTMGVAFSPGTATVLSSDEPAPPPTVTVAYESRGITGILVLESTTPGWAVSPQVVRVEEGRGSFNLTLTPPQNLPAGANAVTIRAFRDGYSTTFSVPLEVRSLSLSLEGQALEGTDGATLRGSTSLQGFTAPSVTFTLEGEGAERFALSPLRAAPGPFSLRIIPTQEATPGLYQLRLRAEAGGVVRKAAFSLRLAAPQISVSLMPQALSVYRGREGNLTLRVRGAPRGTYAVALKDATTGAFISWASLSPASLALEGGEREVGLTLQVGASAPLGSQNLVLVLLGPASAQASLSLTVLQPTFQAALDRTSFTLTPGRSATATLTLSTEGGYSGALSVLLVGNGAERFSVAPSQVNTEVRHWGLVLSAAPDTPTGVYALELVVTDGTTARRIPITVSVSAP